MQVKSCGCRCIALRSAAVAASLALAAAVLQEGEVYVKALGSVNHLEGQFRALWTECQKCQGSLQHDVICTRSAAPDRAPVNVPP